MKKLLLAFLFLPCISFYIKAQSFKITPDTIIEANGKDTDDDLIVAGKFYNITNEKRTYKWYRTKKLLPQGWANTTCVPGYCFTENVEEGSFDLGAMKSGIFDQNFYMFGTDGTAETAVFVYDILEPEKIAKVVFRAKVISSTTAIAEEQAMEEYFKVISNAIEIFADQLKGKHLLLEIFSPEGIRKMEFSSQNTTSKISLDISSLQPGLYLVRLTDHLNLNITKKIYKN